MKRGLLIVFEGIDGTGKSSQLSLLARALRERGLPVVETREPTMGPNGRRIRELYRNRSQVSPAQELELFLADRREHVAEILLPALRAGKIVLCDRYFLSTAAYQGCIDGNDGGPAGPEGPLTPAQIIARNSFAPTPDLAIVLRVPPRVGIERIVASRGDTPNDFEREESLKKVVAIFDRLNLPYIRRFDASGSMESVHQSIMRVVTPLLFSAGHP